MRRTVLFLALLFIPVTHAGFAQSRATPVFVKLNEFILPIARAEKYEDPLDEALREERLGAVTGSTPQRAPDGTLAWVRLDVELTDVPRGLSFLKEKLVELGAPRGSTLQFERRGRKVELPVHE